MCGIVAYVGSRNCQNILLEGIKRLEYRGYDSSGLATLNNGKLQVVRAVGRQRRRSQGSRRVSPSHPPTAPPPVIRDSVANARQDFPAE
jgi:glucosamine 6-phosphate synthetase-like amidotransferase/phosphosugar isomerase protein